MCQYCIKISKKCQGEEIFLRKSEVLFDKKEDVCYNMDTFII